MVLNRCILRDSIQDTMPRRNDVSGLQSGRATARNDILLGVRTDDRDLEVGLVPRERKGLVSVLQYHDSGCGDLSTEFPYLGGIAGPLDTIAENDLRVPLCLLLDKLEEIGDALVDGGDAELLARKGMEDEFRSPPSWGPWHFKIKTSIDGLVNAVSPEPLVESVERDIEFGRTRVPVTEDKAVKAPLHPEQVM